MMVLGLIVPQKYVVSGLLDLLGKLRTWADWVKSPASTIPPWKRGTEHTSELEPGLRVMGHQGRVIKVRSVTGQSVF